MVGGGAPGFGGGRFLRSWGVFLNLVDRLHSHHSSLGRVTTQRGVSGVVVKRYEVIVLISCAGIVSAVLAGQFARKSSWTIQREPARKMRVREA
jgi:hypothetical protein